MRAPDRPSPSAESSGANSRTGREPASGYYPSPDPVPSGRDLFGRAQPDPIERPEYRRNAHPIERSETAATSMMVEVADDGSMLGLTSVITAAVSPESRSGAAGSARFVESQVVVGQDMKRSFEAALRAVRARYPRWEPGIIEFSFSEKRRPHDGASAGTAFSVMLLSMLEGFDIDAKCAVTGDISADWKVRRISGTVAKLRGASGEGCLAAGIPRDNAEQIPDLILMYGDQAIRDMQVLSIGTLQDAVALMRTDRAPDLAEAMKLFAELQPKLKTARADGENAEIEATLQRVLSLAPNHESARWLLKEADGTAPRQLSEAAALYHMMLAMYPYRDILLKGDAVSRRTISPAVTTWARKQLLQLRPITPKDLQQLLLDCASIVETSELVAARQSPPGALDPRRDAWYAHYKLLTNDRDMIEKIIHAGY
jgi:hypothetical protein